MSGFDQIVTIHRLHHAISKQQMTMVAEIDQPLQPTRVFVFGSVLAGTSLMQATSTIAIDLPLKVLVWTDGEGVTWLAYNNPGWLATRHGAPSGTAPIIDAMRRLLALAVGSIAGRD